MSEGFKKPFRARPVVLGPYGRAQDSERRRRNRFATIIKMAALAALIFVFGMLATHMPKRMSHFPVYYRNCAEARAAGVAPIRKGEPGYRRGLDADNDGIACEPYRGSL
jgi:hypothetical protein